MDLSWGCFTTRTLFFKEENMQMWASRQSQGLPVPLIRAFSWNDRKHCGSTLHSVSHRPEVSWGWRPVFLSWELSDSSVATIEPSLEWLIYSEAMRKECELSGFKLPERGWHPAWHGSLASIRNASASSTRCLTRLTWDCSCPGPTGGEAGKGQRLQEQVMPLRTFKKRGHEDQTTERVLRVGMFSKLAN